MKKNIVRVFDTISKKVVRVEVSDEVRTHYKRAQWNIDMRGSPVSTGKKKCFLR